MKYTDLRTFILREARLDVLDPERSEFSRLINKAATDFGREWARQTEENLLAGAIALADEYGERGATVPAIACVAWAVNQNIATLEREAGR